MAKSTIALSREQKSLFQQMPKPLQAAAVKMKRTVDELIRTHLLGRYDMGEQVRDVKNDEEKYGEKAVETMAAFLGISAPTLYSCHQIVKAYSKAEVEQLSRRVGAGGQRISFEHLAILATLTGTSALKHRGKLEKAVIEEGVGVRELATRAQILLGDKRLEGVGRKVKKPRNVLVGIADMDKSTKALLRRIGSWDDGIFTRVENGEDVSKKTVVQLEAVKSTMEDATSKLAEVSKKVDKAIADARKVLARGTRPDAAPVKKKKASPKAATKTGTKKKKKTSAKKAPVKKKKRVSATERIQAARSRRPAA